MNTLWDWLIQTSTSSWVLISLTMWFLVHWLRTSDLPQRMATAERLFLNQQEKLRDLNSDFFDAQARLYKQLASVGIKPSEGGGPYRSAATSRSAAEVSRSDGPVFKKGDAVDVRHKSNAWYRATFEGFLKDSTGAVLVVLESEHTEQWPESGLEMRHARES